ncbi:SufD family Fe-S cluster assembly protein [Candidatus Woesearchaeota archaeon]|nr:SufD family Fe-S cluster assembly protein [Candidatus Woesearchaeota archaeon]
MVIQQPIKETLDQQKNISLSLLARLQDIKLKYGQGMFTMFNNFSLDQFHQQLSASRIKIVPTAPAGVKMYTLEDIPNKLWKKYFTLLADLQKNYPDKLHDIPLAVHYAFLSTCTFIHIPQGFSSTIPITIATDHERGSAAAHYIILAEKQSSVTIIDQSSIAEEAYGLSTVREIYLEEGSVLQYYHLKTAGSNSYHFSTTRSVLGKDSSLQSYDFFCGGKFLQNYYTNSTKGSNSHSQYSCAFFNKPGSEYILFNETAHVHQHTSGLMQVKGLIADNSKVLSRSNISISPQGKFTQSQERSDLLLLGEKAHGEAVPMLEVKNKDVQCSHGSTISKINNDHLFYLQTRGLSEEQAAQAITSAFLQPVVDKFPSEIQLKILSEMEKITVVPSEMLLAGAEN